LKSSGLFTKNSPWQAKHSIPHTTVTFYGEWVKMCEDFVSNFSDKITGSFITITHHLTLPFQQGIFRQNDMTVVPTHPTFLCFLDWR
jgi:hypothetical protein